MKLYPSYVVEAQARRRRRMAVGVVGAIMLATVALTALMVLDPPAAARAPLSGGCLSELASPSPACTRGAG
jgi:hypothetical protein